MKQPILFFSLILLGFAGHAQVKVSGTVKDGRGHGLGGASLTIKDSYDGATSDSTGHYHFTTTEKGAHTLVATSVGYKSVEMPLSIGVESLQVDIQLKETLSELKAVIITAGSFSAGDAKRGAVLNSLDIATTAGSNADITAALKTLPGAQQVGETEGLFVRGGAGYETKQYIDGTMVNNPYYSSVPDIAQRGRFLPFLFKGTVFSTGGYSALYGQALSAVVLLESIDLPEKSEINASISPLFLGLGTQQLDKNKKFSWGINGGYTNVGPYYNLVKQVADFFKSPELLSGDANFRVKTKTGGMIKYYTTYTHNKLGLYRPDIDSPYLKTAFGLANSNWYNNLSWREYLGHNWRMNFGLGYSTNHDDIRQQLADSLNQPRHFPDSVYWMRLKNFSVLNRQDLAQGKFVLEKKLSGISQFRFGGEYQYAYNTSVFNDTLHKLIDNYSAYFAESDIFLTNALAVKLGLRAEYSSLLNQWNLAPRLSLAYKTGKESQVSAAYGIFYQKPENTQLMYSPGLGLTKATHYIINFQKMSTDRILRIEAFYKKYEDLVRTVPVNYYLPGYNNSGSGYAKGIELFWRDKKTIKNFDYWISYSYLDTRRIYLNYPEELVPNFAATHTASIVTKRFFTKLKSGINLTYTFATGRPFYNFKLDGSNKYFIADQGTTNNYNTLNLSLEYVPSIGKTNAKTFVVWFASISNLLGYSPVYGYNYSYRGTVKQPIVPPANRFYFIGCFLSWGVDRSQDAINSNL